MIRNRKNILDKLFKRSRCAVLQRMRLLRSEKCGVDGREHLDVHRGFASVTAPWYAASNVRDSVFSTRSLAYSPGRDRRRCFAQLSRSCATRGGLGLQTILASGTSQHAWHRQRSHFCRHRPRRWRHQNHPCRRGGIMLPNHSPLGALKGVPILAEELERNLVSQKAKA